MEPFTLATEADYVDRYGGVPVKHQDRVAAYLPRASRIMWRVFTPALRRSVEDIVMVRDGTDAPPLDAWRASINWTPARYVSPQASSDFIIKRVQALPRIADTTVALRRAGFTKAEIDEINSETRKTSAVDLIQALNQQPETPSDGTLTVSYST